MRYYSITISPSADSVNSFAPIVYTTLRADGSTNLSALRVDLDIYQSLLNAPAQNGLITIYGVPFNDIGQAANLSRANISISVGMTKGLPLADSKNGLIIQGTILQAYGNHQGTDIRLNLIIIPAGVDRGDNANLAFIWNKGETLQAAITACLQTAYGPATPVLGTISPNLITTETQTGKFSTLLQLSSYIYDISTATIPDKSYFGAKLTYNTNGFYLFDSTTPPNAPKLISYTDIVGNLTWLDIVTIQAKLVMRNDINIGDVIQFPLTVPTVNVALQSGGNRGRIAFDGAFTVLRVRHVGSSRQADANSWVTIIDAQVHNGSLQ